MRPFPSKAPTASLPPLRFDCYRVERTSSRAGVAPAEVQRLFTAHCFNSYLVVKFSRDNTPQATGITIGLSKIVPSALKRPRITPIVRGIDFNPDPCWPSPSSSRNGRKNA
jgi:hypothetical protein